MSNLKKILALVLALVMSFSLVTVSSAAFTDEADINATFTESAEVLANLGVFKGYTDGSFNPKGSITRAEVAAIIYRVATGDVNDKQVSIYADYNVFSDVNSNAWYAGYVNYCANAQYIKGYGNGKFGPNDTVTGYQALAMILRAVGYDKNGEFTGASWQVETAKIGTQLGITRNVTAVLLGTAASREVVAEILFRAIAEAPTVSYSLGLGYSQYKNQGLSGMIKNDTLGEMNFGLEKVAGIINNVTPTKASFGYVDAYGNFIVGDTVYTDALGLEDVGFAAYAWARPTSADKYLTVVSSIYMLGESMEVSTDGTPYALTDTVYNRKVENGALFFYNGQPLVTDVDVDNAIAKLAGRNGVKVEFIDNDDTNALAEVVVITEYTAAYVSAYAKDTMTGIDGIKKGYYFSTNMAKNISEALIVTEDELVVGDVITYVLYNGYYYVDEAEAATGKYLKAENVYNWVGTENYSREYFTVYTIGENKFAASFAYNVTALSDVVNELHTSYVGKTLVVYTDAYGNILRATEYVPASDYLYVINSDHASIVDGTARATVVFADGTVEKVILAKGTLETLNEVAGHMYTYTVKDGVYTLGTKDCAKADLMFHTDAWDYYNPYKNNTNLAGAFATVNTVVVDLRYYATAGVKVYTGYAEIPSIVGGVWHYVTDAYGFISLAFLTNGVNYSEVESEFIVFDAAYGSYGYDENGVKWYYMDVLVDGDMTTISLSAEQYGYILTHGVGSYYMYDDTLLTGYESYTSFAEEWYDVVWQNGTIVLKDTATGAIVTSYAYGVDSVKFWTLDIANGMAYNYLPVVGQDGWFNNVHAYVVRDRYSNVVEIYIVKGTLAAKTGEPTAIDGSYKYWAAEGYVTNFEIIDEDLETILNNIQAAYDAIAEGEAILAGANAISTAAATATKTEVEKVKAAYAAGEYDHELEYAVELIKAALKDLDAAKTKLEALTDLSASDAAIVAEMKAEIVADTTKYTALVAQAVASDAYVLADLKAEKATALATELAEAIIGLGTAYKIKTDADVYVLGSDVYFTDCDAAVYVLNSDAKIVVNGATTSIYAIVAEWVAAFEATTTESEINALATDLRFNNALEKIAAIFFAASKAAMK